jgi:hypothetical protein
MRTIKKPKAPKLKASEQAWTTYRGKLAEYNKFLKALDARRKLKNG